jgi:hypothetical protein
MSVENEIPVNRESWEKRLEQKEIRLSFCAAQGLIIRESLGLMTLSKPTTGPDRTLFTGQSSLID